jgi:hypothetical protein
VCACAGAAAHAEVALLLWPAGTHTDETSSQFVCECSAGYSGAICETNVDECASQPCSSHGVCVDGLLHFQCDCHAVGDEHPALCHL